MPAGLPRRPGARLRLALLLAGLLAALPLGAGRATEGGYVPGPLGGSDLRAALAPPPGSYLLLMPLAGRVRDLRDNDGRTVPLGFSGGTLGAGLGLYHVFEDRLAGGRVGAGFITAAARVCLRSAVLRQGQCQFGLADTYLEAFWSRPLGELGLPGPAADDPRRQVIPYGLTLGLNLGAVLPTGAYRRTDAAAIGLNTMVLAPSLAATWISPPLLADGTELSTRLFLDIHGRNRATGYRAGELLVLDWALTERAGRYQFGAAGSYAHQLRPDRLAGQRGPDTQVLSLGGVVAADLPEQGMFVAFKALRDLDARTRMRVDRAILRIGMRF